MPLRLGLVLSVVRKRNGISVSARHEGFPPEVGFEKWLKTATSAELYANGYQTMEQYDPARDLRSAQAQMKFANDLGFAIAGPQVAAVAG